MNGSGVPTTMHDTVMIKSGILLVIVCHNWCGSSFLDADSRQGTARVAVAPLVYEYCRYQGPFLISVPLLFIFLLSIDKLRCLQFVYRVEYSVVLVDVLHEIHQGKEVLLSIRRRQCE